MDQSRKNDIERFIAGFALDYGNDLVRFIAKRVRNDADARDLAQEAYIRLLRVERQDLIRDPRPYLYRVAANILSEFELKRKAEVAGLTRWSEVNRADVDSDQSACLDFLEGEAATLHLRQSFEAVLGQLSPKCRAVLILHRRDRMTYEEIAAKIGISKSMVKKYLGRGLRHCREHLQELR